MENLHLKYEAAKNQLLSTLLGLNTVKVERQEKKEKYLDNHGNYVESK